MCMRARRGRQRPRRGHRPGVPPRATNVLDEQADHARVALDGADVERRLARGVALVYVVQHRVFLRLLQRQRELASAGRG